MKINDFLSSAAVCKCLWEGDCLQLGNEIYANVSWECMHWSVPTLTPTGSFNVVVDRGHRGKNVMLAMIDVAQNQHPNTAAADQSDCLYSALF